MDSQNKIFPERKIRFLSLLSFLFAILPFVLLLFISDTGRSNDVPFSSDGLFKILYKIFSLYHHLRNLFPSYFQQITALPYLFPIYYSLIPLFLGRFAILLIRRNKDHFININTKKFHLLAMISIMVASIRLIMDIWPIFGLFLFALLWLGFGAIVIFVGLMIFLLLLRFFFAK